MVAQARFTAAPPGIEERVANLLLAAGREVAEITRCESLLLLGSFGRGEGWVTGTDDKLQFISDVELAAVSWRPDPAACRYASDLLSARLEAEVNVYPTPRLRFTLHRTPIPKYRFDRPLLGTFHIRHCSQVLHGGDLMSSLPAIDPKSIPKSEALRLMGNRAGEAMASQDLHRFSTKLAIAAGEAVLLQRSLYHQSVEARMISLHEITAREPRLGEVSRVFVQATRAKQGARAAPRFEDAARAFSLAMSAADPARTLAEDLNAREFSGNNHSGPMPTGTLWNLALRRRLRNRGLVVRSTYTANLEYVVYAGLVTELLGSEFPGAEVSRPDGSPARWKDAWLALR